MRNSFRVKTTALNNNTDYKFRPRFWVNIKSLTQKHSQGQFYISMDNVKYWNLLRWMCLWRWDLVTLTRIVMYVLYDLIMIKKQSRNMWSFLGAFTKLRKATTSFVMTVCPSAWNNSVPIGWIFMKLDVWVFFENLSKKLNFH